MFRSNDIYIEVRLILYFLDFKYMKSEGLEHIFYIENTDTTEVLKCWVLGNEIDGKPYRNFFLIQKERIARITGMLSHDIDDFYDNFVNEF